VIQERLRGEGGGKLAGPSANLGGRDDLLQNHWWERKRSREGKKKKTETMQLNKQKFSWKSEK